jgi:hypothetical protein
MMRRALIVLLLFALPALGQSVRYRSQNNVYLDAGMAAGVNVGDRFEVLRDNNVIATVEVIHAAERSASCRIVSETTPIREGDRVRRIGAPVSPQPQRTAAAAPDGLKPVATSWTPSLAGNVSLDFETNDRDYDRTLARVSLRARDIASLPIHVRVRFRASEESRENRNRLYEASVMYEPRDFRIAVRAGRLGNTPFIGLGYLDGALVRARIAGGVEAGAFYGFRPDPTDLAFDTSTTKYGGYVRAGADPHVRRPWDLIVAAVRQQSDDDTGDATGYVALDGRYAPTDRVSFFGHGRIGSGGEEASLDTILSMVTRITANQTLTLAYERVEPGEDDDLRTNDQLVEDFLRQGFRVTLQHRFFHLGAGARTGEDETTYSATAGVAHPNIAGRAFFAGLGATGFSSELTDGVFVHARAGKRLARGHTIELTGGALVTDESAIEELQSTAWLRAALWLELPADLFGRVEYELTAGDTPTGNRLMLGVGYRF